jgi:fumarylacetoacetase
VAPERGSWVPGADGSGFGIEHLPCGIVRRAGSPARAAVRIGAWALDLAEVVDAGLLVVPGLTVEVLRSPTLNGFLELGPSAWSATRASLIALLDAGGGGEREAGGAEREIGGGEREVVTRALLPLEAVEVLLPVAVGDYVDFYSSLAHASNLGRIMRPGSEGLLPNWRHLPVGYHGRAGSIVVSGTPIQRPCGQRGPDGGSAGPSFGPERQLDFELELGFVTGEGPRIARDGRAAPIAAREAGEYIFGVVLVNDWSAREIQRWEAQPLGPFLGKSFATSIAGWITPLEALAAHRVPGAAQDPPVLPYLRTDEPWTFDIDLEVAIVPAGSRSETTVTRTSARELYWNAAQQLAHASSGGAAVRAGDLFASGTISGAEPGSYGSMIELSWGGALPLTLGGTTRTFLEDGDTVIMRGAAAGGGGGGGRARLALGEVRGTVVGAA